MSSAVRLKWRSASSRCSTRRAKNTKSAAGAGRSGPVRLSRQNLVEWWTPGNRNSSFSKLCKLASDRDRIRSRKKNFVVSSRRDARRDDASDAALRTDELAVRLGEDRVGVHVPPAAERVATGVADEVAFALGPPPVVEERPGEGWVVVDEPGDHLAPGGGVRGLRDLGPALGEPLLLLELDPLPGRVAEHDVEPAAPPQDVIVFDPIKGLEDVGERQVPVEELVLPGQPGDLILRRLRHLVRVLARSRGRPARSARPGA